MRSVTSLSVHEITDNKAQNERLTSGAHPFFFGGGDPEAIYNLFHFINYVINIKSYV